MAPISRRAVNRLLLAAPALPAALAAAHAQDAPPRPSAFAACIAASEPSLSADERARLQKSLAGLEQSLAAIRDFKVPPDAHPAMFFRPLKSVGRP
jgi:hypothetical protein